MNDDNDACVGVNTRLRLALFDVGVWGSMCSEGVEAGDRNSDRNTDCSGARDTRAGMCVADICNELVDGERSEADDVGRDAVHHNQLVKKR
jgi:hypothetical protein